MHSHPNPHVLLMHMIASAIENTAELLDKKEAATFLRVSTRTVDDWMRRRRIPYAKLPSGAVRFRRSQLLEFVAKFEVAA